MKCLALSSPNLRSTTELINCNDSLPFLDENGFNERNTGALIEEKIFHFSQFQVNNVFCCYICQLLN